MISAHTRFVSLLISAVLLTGTAFAKQGATDPIPGTSKGTVNSGGGGGGGGGGSGGGSGGGGTISFVSPTTPIVLPPAPPPSTFTPVVLAFTPAAPVNGIDPVCSGDYHIDPYYPTLYLLTVNVDMTSVNAPDNSAFSVSVTGTGGTLYPFTSNVLSTIGGTGLCTYSVYITPGTTITGVSISDSSGQVIATGK